MIVTYIVTYLRTCLLMGLRIRVLARHFFCGGGGGGGGGGGAGGG